jgi:hypothetical protein
MSSSEAQTDNGQTDNRRVIGEHGISAENSTVNVQTLDAQVVNRVLETGEFSIDRALKFGTEALNYSKSSQAQALDSLNTTANLVKNAYEDAKGRGALTDQILIGSVVMAGLVAMAAIKK